MRRAAAWLSTVMVTTVISGAVCATVAAQMTPRVPIGYDPRPDGTTLRTLGSPRIGGNGFTADIRNDGQGAITGIRYVAIVMRVPTWPTVDLQMSDVWPVSAGPGATFRIESTWLDEKAVEKIAAADTSRAQMFLAPVLIRYADGSEWRLRLNPTATDFVAAMQGGEWTRPASVPR